MLFFNTLFLFVLNSYGNISKLISSLKQRIKIELITFLFFTVGYQPATVVLDPQQFIEGGLDPPIDDHHDETNNIPQFHSDHCSQVPDQ